MDLASGHDIMMASVFAAERGYLLSRARAKLRDEHAAEDVVQETLLAALEGHQRFRGESQLRTWLCGILKHKIVDHIRLSRRTVSLEMVEASVPGGGMTNDVELGNAPASEALPPSLRGDPLQELEGRRFYASFDQIMAGMAPRTARAFYLHELAGQSTEEICQDIGVTPSHCWVLLHRARLALRSGLETAAQN